MLLFQAAPTRGQEASKSGQLVLWTACTRIPGELQARVQAVAGLPVAGEASQAVLCVVAEKQEGLQDCVN